MVCAILDIRRGILPDGGGVLGVVGDQHLHDYIRRQGAHDVHNHHRNGIIRLQRRCQRDSGLGHLFGKGHRVGGAVSLAVIGHHFEGVGAVEDFLPVGSRDSLECVDLAQGCGVGALEHIVQVLLDRHGVPVHIVDRVLEVKARRLCAQVGAVGRGAGDGGRSVDGHSAVIAHREGGGESESGAGPVGAGAAVVEDIATGVQANGVAGAVRVRGAGPLNNGGAVHVGDLERAGDFQRRALHIKPACRSVQLSGRQQENGPLERANGVVAVAGGVLDFRGADDPTDVCIKQVFVGAVEPAINGAGGVGIDIGAVPLAGVIAVLADHQRAAHAVEGVLIVVLGNIEAHQLAVFLELDDTAHSFVAQGGCGHRSDFLL